MFNIFVSYPQPHLPWAVHLKGMLSAPGVSVFVAEHDLPPGASLSAEIARAIQQADLFILFWSKAAQASAYVGKEIFAAKTSGRAIVPVMLEPGVPLPLELGDIKYMDLTKDPTSQLTWLKHEVDRRAQSKGISTLVGGALIAFLGWAIIKGNT